MRARVVGLLITLVLAAAGGALAWWLASPAVTPDPPLTERAAAAAAGLGADGHVYVDPAASGVFSAEELDRLGEAAATSDPQVFVVVWPASDQAGYGSTSDVLRQIGGETERPGVYVEVDPGVDVDSADIGIEGEYFSLYGALDDETEWTSAAETDRLLAAIDENDGREYTVGEDTGSHYWGGTGGMITAGLVIGGLSGIGAGLVGLAAWAIVRHRRAAA
ncbi:hypothetical protein [Jiangella mangrovi]|uniref:TPM domain-containing protein n=1 Tax=Jiangella mangrovi TaxID=1524084 RepID=A0A7W9GXA1_9ACTN|nr:hypothetical protein [Jiangella mangrovi]MBB5791719.1 hypothetical protein [Jiangella mangrovi]